MEKKELLISVDNTTWGMSDSIAAMKKVPGKHFIGTPFNFQFGVVTPVEVDEDGTVHQLNPDGQRDGILDDEGWNIRCIEITQAQIDAGKLD